jgi:hypothetical protein
MPIIRRLRSAALRPLPPPPHGLLLLAVLVCARLAVREV